MTEQALLLVNLGSPASTEVADVRRYLNQFLMDPYVVDLPWPLRRLLVAQDTGGAIRGPVRGDVFWGAGALAEHLAGHMKSEGRLYLLLPRTLVPAS